MIMKDKESLFSHIYIEERALSYPFTDKIIQRFPNAKRVIIGHYKNVFNRPRQDFVLQKQAPKLILAVKEEPFLYEGPEVCEDFGYDNFYYASTLLNCLYNCDYCYLQGLYPSANIVAFVNIGDFFAAVEKQLAQRELYLCVSYDTDLLAFEGLLPYTASWIEFARKHQNLLVEIRTKSANFNKIKQLEPVHQAILAWSMSPAPIAERYEKLAPGLESRLKAAAQAIEYGWKVRLSLEPVLKVEDWKEIYSHFVDRIFEVLPADKIHDINIGAFRMSRDYYKKISQMRSDTDVFAYPVETKDGVVSYKDEHEIRKFVFDKLVKYCAEEKIFI